MTNETDQKIEQPIELLIVDLETIDHFLDCEDETLTDDEAKAFLDYCRGQSFHRIGYELIADHMTAYFKEWKKQ